MIPSLKKAAEDAADAAEAAKKAADEAKDKADQSKAAADKAAANADAASVAAAEQAQKDAEAAAEAAKKASEAADAAAEAAKKANDAAQNDDNVTQEAKDEAAANAEAASKAAETAKTAADNADTAAKAAKTATDKAKANKAAADKAKEAAKNAAAGVPTIDTVAAQSKKTMTVTWGKVSGAAKYVVSYRKAGGKWTNVTTTSTSYKVKKLKKKGMYEFRVASVSSSGVQSAWSKVDYRYFFGKNPTLKRGKGFVRVRWAKDKSATGYQLFYSTNKNMSGQKVVTLGKNTRSYKITGLKKGQRVYVRIRPIKSSGGNTYVGVLTNKKSAKAK